MANQTFFYSEKSFLEAKHMSLPSTMPFGEYSNVSVVKSNQPNIWMEYT